MNLADVIVTIDTREQSQPRIRAVEDFVALHGGATLHAKLDLCDYHVEGEFRGVKVDLGIEAKSLSDFMGSHGDLPDKLFRAFDLYDEVALFIEEGALEFTVNGDGWTPNIVHPAHNAGVDATMNLHAYRNALGSWAREGVHVRALTGVLEFPHAMAGLMVNLAKPVHEGLHLDTRGLGGYRAAYLNTLAKVPGVGPKHAYNILKSWTNWDQLARARKMDLQQVLGIALGRKVYDFVRSTPGVRQEVVHGD